MLVEVDPVEVAEIRWVGLLGWVDALAMKTRKGSSRPRRAWSSSGVQSSLIKIGQRYEEVYKGTVLCVAWLCLSRAVGKTGFQLVMTLLRLFFLFVARVSSVTELTGSVA